MLVVYAHALQTIDLLDFFNEIFRKRLNAQHRENVLWGGVSVQQIFAAHNPVAVLHREMLTFGDQISRTLLSLVVRNNQDLTLVLVILTKLNATINFGNDCMVFWTTRFKQFGNPWQTTRDVPCLGTTCGHT